MRHGELTTAHLGGAVPHLDGLHPAGDAGVEAARAVARGDLEQVPPALRGGDVLDGEGVGGITPVVEVPLAVGVRERAAHRLEPLRAEGLDALVARPPVAGRASALRGVAAHREDRLDRVAVAAGGVLRAVLIGVGGGAARQGLGDARAVAVDVEGHVGRALGHAEADLHPAADDGDAPDGGGVRAEDVAVVGDLRVAHQGDALGRGDAGAEIDLEDAVGRERARVDEALAHVLAVEAHGQHLEHPVARGRGGQLHPDAHPLALVGEARERDGVGAGEERAAQGAGDPGSEADPALRSLQPEERAVHQAEEARHAPELTLRVDHRAAGGPLLHPVGAAHGLEVLHVGEVQRRAAHHRSDRVVHRVGVAGPGRGLGPEGGDEGPDGAVVVDGRLLLLRPDHRRALGQVRIAGHHLGRLRGRGHVEEHGEGRAEQVVLQGGRRIEVGGDEGGVELPVGEPESIADGAGERGGPAGVLLRSGGVALLGGQLGGHVEHEVVGDVGAERLAHPDLRRVGGGPGGIRLLAPVEERLLTSVEAVLRVPDHQPIVLGGVDDGLVGEVAEAVALGAREHLEQLPRAHRPHYPIGGDGPAPAGARVLHDLALGPVAPRAQLELERVPGAGRIVEAEAERDGVGGVAGPHVLPLAAGLEAAAGRAGQGVAAVEGAVGDGRDRVLARLLHGERVERVEQVVAGAHDGLAGLLAEGARVRREVVAPRAGRGEHVGARAARRVLHGHAGLVRRVRPGVAARRAGPRRGETLGRGRAAGASAAGVRAAGAARPAGAARARCAAARARAAAAAPAAPAAPAARGVGGGVGGAAAEQGGGERSEAQAQRGTARVHDSIRRAIGGWLSRASVAPPGGALSASP